MFTDGLVTQKNNIYDNLVPSFFYKRSKKKKKKKKDIVSLVFVLLVRGMPFPVSPDPCGIL